MFFKDFFAKKEPRRFAYVPYYYRENDDQQQEAGSRIRFKRIRQGSHVSRKSIRGMLLMVVFIIVCLIYFWEMLEREMRTFEMESIKIEEIPLIE